MTTPANDHSQTGLDREHNQKADVNQEAKEGKHGTSADPAVNDAMAERKKEIAD